jgi:hypothetical protein
MDSGENEKAVANSLKEIVKHTSRYKAAARISKTRDSVIKIAPKSSTEAQERSPCPRPGNQHDTTPLEEIDFSQKNFNNLLHNTITVRKPVYRNT